MHACIDVVCCTKPLAHIQHFFHCTYILQNDFQSVLEMLFYSLFTKPTHDCLFFSAFLLFVMNRLIYVCMDMGMCMLSGVDITVLSCTLFLNCICIIRVHYSKFFMNLCVDKLILCMCLCILIFLYESV